MMIFPAIDIRNGKCVRLLQGRRDRETVYGDDPAAVARQWAAAGAGYLHIVDLDGAFSGNPLNEASVIRIREAVSIPIQLGGGIRTIGDMARQFAMGVTRVIAGTVAVSDPDLIKRAIDRWGPEHVVVGIDARDGYVAVRGWEQGSALSARDVGNQVRAAGVVRIVYTDIARDGMMTGPNMEATRRIARETGLRVIASGGVSGMDDLVAVAEAENDGIEGVIVGKALYEGAIDLAEAVRRFGG
ncbi:MAG: 1-(5-phosphoribosyl)-5-[(5-phosphoribosylamino)methylideneamino]imidazole-4-carboxamide isomerase [candidate division Zixibacteria bacterium]|nr:1-(5-phosphoribosyl)-5-[(5-phosphoribosylamino)methylideneamino]imidazole-4-carboxamide isomerase [candidate division Zixibacteria bacterium]